jgi:4-diphosphocytidyl-2-C-methyl-D-erythritol kinase
MSIAPAQLTVPAPAKINLFLRITGRRADGYHALQTVFQFINLSDDVHLRIRSDGHIMRPCDIDGVPIEDDLCVRAARLLREFAGTSAGADVWVDKRIPMGGGLGGGSSNAASVLLGLNRLWQLDLSAQQLADIGLQLGADVPVFVHGHSTWAEGVGELMTPLNLETRSILLALPRVHVATAEVFAAENLTRDSIPLTINGFPRSDSLHPVHHLMMAGNVCEAVVRARYKPVRDCLDWLARFGVTRMTGTGAACFALVDVSTPVRVPADAPWSCLRVEGLNRSPALDAVSSAPS